MFEWGSKLNGRSVRNLNQSYMDGTDHLTRNGARFATRVLCQGWERGPLRDCEPLLDSKTYDWMERRNGARFGI